MKVSQNSFNGKKKKPPRSKPWRLLVLVWEVSASVELEVPVPPVTSWTGIDCLAASRINRCMGLVGPEQLNRNGARPVGKRNLTEDGAEGQVVVVGLGDGIVADLALRAHPAAV